MIRRQLWARIPADADRCLVYGPRFGRLYLLTRHEAKEPALLQALGLGHWEAHTELTDPVVRVAYQRSAATIGPAVVAPLRLRIAYRLLHVSRYVLPFPIAACVIVALFRRTKAGVSTAKQIGQLIHATEQATGLSDCYPRALLTCALGVASGFACDLVIGSLVPTRMMHAWCSLNGELPYEVSPEHYLYQPLILMTLAS